MFVLDIRTLSVITMLFSLIFFAGLLTFARNNRRFYGIRYFAYGDLFLFLGFFLLSLRNLINVSASVIVANTFIALAFLMFTMGGYSFLRMYMRLLWLHIFALIVLIGSFAYFTLFDPNVNARIVIITAFIFMEMAVSSFIFLSSSRHSYKKQKSAVSSGYIALALYSIFRIVWTLLEIPLDDFLQAGITHGLMFVFVQIVIVNTAFSIIWIANSILNDDLEDRAKLDPLTSILNRRAFVEELLKELARAKRESQTFSLVMADIDHFKSVNDNYGHLAGDSVLISFTSIVQQNLRINDILARYGGEEFLILLPNTEKKQAVETAERIRKVIENSHHPFNGKDIQYTVSFGVTSFDIDAQNKDELLENADIALYDAKSKGRNRVEFK